jgi:hypothetical protein
MKLWGSLFLSLSLAESVELTLRVVNQWTTLSMVEKLPYLFSEYDWNLYYQELQLIWNYSMSSHTSPEQQQPSPLVPVTIVAIDNLHLSSDNLFPEDFYRDLISEDLFLNYHQEFQDLPKIREFWSICDGDHNGYLNLVEYSLCRAEADQHGNFFERSELDYLEEVVMKEFWDKVSGSDYQPENYRYDEDGIIIDE